MKEGKALSLSLSLSMAYKMSELQTIYPHPSNAAEAKKKGVM